MTGILLSLFANMRSFGSTIIVSFTAGSGSWLCPTGVSTVDYLVVGGGGSGGSDAGGGGGAGGFRTGTGLAVVAGTSYTVTIGAGGVGITGNPPQAAGNAGSDSVFSTITSTGGEW